MADLDFDTIRNLIFLIITIFFLVGRGASKKSKKQYQDPEYSEDMYDDPSLKYEPVQQQVEVITKQPVKKEIIFENSPPLTQKINNFEAGEKSNRQLLTKETAVSQRNGDLIKNDNQKKLKRYLISDKNIKSAIIYKEILEPKYF